MIRNNELHVLPLETARREPRLPEHQEDRTCPCGPTFAFDARGVMPADDIKVFVHRGPGEPPIVPRTRKAAQSPS